MHHKMGNVLYKKYSIVFNNLQHGYLNSPQ